MPTTTQVVALGLLVGAQGARLHGCGLFEGYCFGYFSGTWCWLTYDGKRDWASEKCETWDGYDSTDYCKDGGVVPQANDAGTLIADCAEKRKGTLVDYGPWKFNTPQCTELAMQCIEDAKDHDCDIADHPSIGSFGPTKSCITRRPSVATSPNSRTTEEISGTHLSTRPSSPSPSTAVRASSPRTIRTRTPSMLCRGSQALRLGP